MTILGLHHITLICSDAQQTVDFYTQTLGLRLVKQTVNFDDPASYHLYFGDDLGRPGSAVTFFEWPGAPRGQWGMGGTHHFALAVASLDGLLQWKRRLTDRGLAVDGPLDRHYFTSIYFQDPDGAIIEIATLGPGWAVDEVPEAIGTAFRTPPPEMLVNNRDEARIKALTWPEPVPAITPTMALHQGMHHITAICADIQRTDAFLGGLLGMRKVKMTSNFDDPKSAHWYWGAGDGRPGTLITYFERDPARVPPARFGPGQAHHYALALADEPTQLAWREALVRAIVPVSPVRDRVYFKSIYTQDPDGHIVELATVGPGFTIDEEPAHLGRALQLPPWLKPHQRDIERNLKPLGLPAE
jgi:glyoxalase family protein